MMPADKSNCLTDVAADNIIVDHSINQSTPTTNDVFPLKMSRGRIMKNLILLCFCYFLFFTGFWALTNLESTMNAEKGLGPESQAVIYGFSMISSLLLPDVLIGRLGSKRTYILAMLLSGPYIASNLSLRWDTMMIGAALFGLASGPLSTAASVYIDEMAIRYKDITKYKQETITACFFGIYLFFGENTQVWGNVISYFALSLGKHVPPPNNFSLETHCGINFASKKDNITNTNLEPPPDRDRHILIGTFLAMGVVALILTGFFVDPLNNDVRRENDCQAVKSRLIAAVKLLKNPNLLLLIPCSAFCGLQSSFYSNDFTKAYIACSWGIHHVGFVTICFGVCGAIMAVLVGPLVRCISQMSVLILAACINVTTCGLLYVWEPTPDNVTTYFVFAGVWGMADAIWWSQITALYGLMFPNDREAAFSNFFFWSFLGFFLCYSYANYFSVALKLGILLFFLVTGIICYLIGQIKIKRSPRREYIVIEDE
ncbi:protein unc-93 homolog A-like isoform X2 [Stegodyphus dumicola]|uniref:protein unc-93 homolog A-like isoform X2 n=1 Tax=Stegodyphus dumicola TaxID=202533 RepID=UPI0015AA3AF4|nr:protein unc-93 homolog A-like isoform X2 [Stegodyphus dumicola]